MAWRAQEEKQDYGRDQPQEDERDSRTTTGNLVPQTTEPFRQTSEHGRCTDRYLARIFHEFSSRDREEECAIGNPQGLESEAYLNSASQGEPVEGIPEGARKDGQIRGRSSQLVQYPR